MRRFDRNGDAAQPPGPLVWTLPEPAKRTSGLDRARIVAAAVTIADAEGSAALTMRRVASEVGSPTPMSLYRYVGSKDGLVDLMIDAVYGEVELPDAPSGDWRADLELLARRTWSVIERHLWFGELWHTRPPIGPHALDYFEYRLAVLATLDLGADLTAQITGAVDGHLLGSALQLAEERRMRERTGLLTDQQLRDAAQPIHERLLSDGRHPRFARWVREQTGNPPESHFEFALRSLLDGISARLGA